MKRIFKRVKRGLSKVYFCAMHKFCSKKYKRKYPGYLRKLGINIPPDYYESGRGYIAPTVWFDANDYSLISIGKATTISLDVVFLTHDYSISKALKTIGNPNHARFLKAVSVGENCFIGMRAILLPGTSIGNNTIVGAGAVVKGKFPDNVVIAGNPAKVICTTEEFAHRHLEKKDFQLLDED